MNTDDFGLRAIEADLKRDAKKSEANREKVKAAKQKP